jgi:molybdopterin-containing oxidoreductase family membrane subunit
MFEKVFKGSPKYYVWVGCLFVVMALGGLAYLQQWNEGLSITGLHRSVPWGLYIAQFTFMVGVAASAVMVVLPYYLHDFKAFGKITVLGEFVAISSVIVCMCFIFVDMGNPARILNIFLYPTSNSVMFWDSVVLFGYLILNVLISWVTFGAERKGVAPPKWIKPFIYLSIPWAVSIHTVTAFLYAGLGGRPFWMSAILAPRFLASAFATGPSLLIIICLILRKFTKFDVGDKPIQKLGEIVTYAMIINIFFVLMELFTALYSGIPEHQHHFEYMFLGLHGADNLVAFMWASQVFAVVALTLLVFPKLRHQTHFLATAAVFVILSLWLDKGMGMVVTGFVPNPVGKVMEYMPTAPEVAISLAIYAMGLLFLTGFYKIAVSVREEVEGL